MTVQATSLLSIEVVEYVVQYGGHRRQSREFMLLETLLMPPTRTLLAILVASLLLSTVRAVSEADPPEKGKVPVVANDPDGIKLEFVYWPRG